MTDRTQHDDIERALAQTLAPYSIELSVQRWTSDQTAIVTVSRHGFEAIYRMAWLPHVTLSELARVDQLDRTHRLLVTGPRISSRTAEALVAADIDYLDYAGNVHLEFLPVLIDVRGRRSPTKEPTHRSTDANLFSARRMQVLFALLSWPDMVEMPVRRIAEAAGTSVGIAQSTLEIMKDSDYLVGKSLRRRDELIDLWSAAFRGALLPKLRLLAFHGSIESWRPLPGDLVSGESAVGMIRQPQTLTIYTEHFDLTVAVRNRWQKSNNPNIEVRQRFWKAPDGAIPLDKQGAFVTSAAPPLLVYADLLTSKEARQAEVARTLRRDHLV
ncbi:type IV toxin-antitoxin system AbiEi family antitoxin [Nocardia sp. NPDC049149]|uniref:type IV toxin-antitoxin system AbiEi family antitoxin n=1 Tax=Nocardia sp. NPDC049149 TaxID=3364315 RepID=UPI00371378AC